MNKHTELAYAHQIPWTALVYTYQYAPFQYLNILITDYLNLDQNQMGIYKFSNADFQRIWVLKIIFWRIWGGGTSTILCWLLSCEARGSHLMGHRWKDTSGMWRHHSCYKSLKLKKYLTGFCQVWLKSLPRQIGALQSDTWCITTSPANRDIQRQ